MFKTYNMKDISEKKVENGNRERENIEKAWFVLIVFTGNSRRFQLHVKNYGFPWLAFLCYFCYFEIFYSTFLFNEN